MLLGSAQLYYTEAKVKAELDLMVQTNIITTVALGVIHSVRVEGEWRHSNLPGSSRSEQQHHETTAVCQPWMK